MGWFDGLFGGGSSGNGSQSNNSGGFGGLFGFFPDDANKPTRSTVNGNGNVPCPNSETALRSYARSWGQFHDAKTGITGFNPLDALDQYEAMYPNSTYEQRMDFLRRGGGLF